MKKAFFTLFIILHLTSCYTAQKSNSKIKGKYISLYAKWHYLYDFQDDSLTLYYHSPYYHLEDIKKYKIVSNDSTLLLFNQSDTVQVKIKILNKSHILLGNSKKLIKYDFFYKIGLRKKVYNRFNIKFAQ